MAASIGLFSLGMDLHAHVIADVLRSLGTCDVHFVATDEMSTAGGLHYRFGGSEESSLRTTDGRMIDPSQLDLVWWRRVNQPQRTPADADPVVEALINSEWKAALSGLIFRSFRGTWVNDPWRDVLAGNKLYQLAFARQAGFRVPETIVSQIPDEVRGFASRYQQKIVAKKLMGVPTKPLATVVPDFGLVSDEQIALCPHMYQQQVHGNRHLRFTCFGDTVHAVSIDSDVLDWRRDLGVPFRPWAVPREIHAAALELLRILGLEMGIMDLMISDDGDIYWIELNSQGQFLFGEALSGHPVAGPFARFLADRAAGGRLTGATLSSAVGETNPAF